MEQISGTWSSNGQPSEMRLDFESDGKFRASAWPAELCQRTAPRDWREFDPSGLISFQGHLELGQGRFDYAGSLVPDGPECPVILNFDFWRDDDGGYYLKIILADDADTADQYGQIWLRRQV
ncbi:hypothetical protein K8F61_09745 [Microbacterium resistens]|uniref:DUF1579 domain-containing protein n=1 Tax=Microbacterium resistens TaxID=156977 RepID=A0ABY3RMS2_9MICO|nr:hypothetical protein [Microbacterium resistens]UGS24992.1 hypothetical protein K8F61_09745 [Microbacterium resistens]